MDVILTLGALYISSSLFYGPDSLSVLQIVFAVTSCFGFARPYCFDCQNNICQNKNKNCISPISPKYNLFFILADLLVLYSVFWKGEKENSANKYWKSKFSLIKKESFQYILDPGCLLVPYARFLYTLQYKMSQNFLLLNRENLNSAFLLLLAIDK